MSTPASEDTQLSCLCSGLQAKQHTVQQELSEGLGVPWALRGGQREELPQKKEMDSGFQCGYTDIRNFTESREGPWEQRGCSER